MVSGSIATRSRRLLIGLGLLLSLLAPVTARADVDEVTAVASPARLEVGESFVYRVTVTGTGSLPMPTVNLPSMFQIIAGPNSNMSMQIVNGRMSTERTLTYRLRALRQGDHVIPAPEVRVRGKAKQGNPITIQVSAPGGSGSSSGASSSQPSSTPQSGDSPSAPPPSTPSSADEPIFLQVSATTQDVTLQEPIVVTWTLYFRPSVRTYDVRRLASTEGFWSEQWDVPNPPDVYKRQINGVTYNAAMIHRLILFPSRSGELTIGPMEVVVQYEGRRSRGLLDDFFDDSFFTGGLQEMELKSNPLTIHVDPLPQRGMPENFDEMVGNYWIDAKLEPASASVNESVVLTVTIGGDGNIGFIPAPQVNVPTDLERYEPEVSVDKTPDAGTLTGKKEFRYLLIPRRAGEQTIPPITISYFDPDEQRYLTKSTKPLELVVRPGTIIAGEESGPNGGAPARVETVGRDIRWILDSAKGLRQSVTPVTERTGYWLSYLLPLGVAGLGLGLRRLREVQRGREGQIRSRKAARHARVALKQARDQLAAGEIEAGYTALSRGMIGYLADRLSLPTGELDPARRRQVLTEWGVEEANVAILEEILERCNTARFTPQGADSQALESLIARANDWIGSVDKCLSAKR